MIEKYIQMGEKGYTAEMFVHENEYMKLEEEAIKKGYYPRGNQLQFNNFVIKKLSN